VQIVSKATRLANLNLQHQDSIHDLGVYTAMLESLLPDHILEEIVDDLPF
jgi:hypothetical protein